MKQRNLLAKFVSLEVFLGLNLMLWLALREDPSRLPSTLIEKMCPLSLCQRLTAVRQGFPVTT